MLKDDFYTISSIKSIENRKVGTAHLNSTHPIFDGHFPDIPIVPGVVLMQMVKEIVESELGFQLCLVDAKNVKFLDFINPLETIDLDFEIVVNLTETNLINVQASVRSESSNHFKLSANYKQTTN